MSGLTVGFFSIDPMRLDILKESTNPNDVLEKVRAEKVEPVLRNHHKLLVTLLLTNAAAMEALPIFLDKLVPTYLAIILSVTFVLFFGEVIPQALCTKSPLAIGAAAVPLIKCLMAVELPLTWPIAKMLDLILGHDTKHYLFKRQDLATLIGFHSSQRGGELADVDEIRIMQGALRLRHVTVADAMTPKNKINSLDEETILDEAAMAQIMANGHSRVPVFRGNPHNIVGILLIKRLILVDPEEHIPVKQIIARRPLVVSKTTNLYELLNTFQDMHNHLAIVVNDENSVSVLQQCLGEALLDVPVDCKIMGLITIEDVIEELIQEEIWDETDNANQELHTLYLSRMVVTKWRSFVARKKKLRANPNSGTSQVHATAVTASVDTGPLGARLKKTGLSVTSSGLAFVGGKNSGVSPAMIARGLDKAVRQNDRVRKRRRRSFAGVGAQLTRAMKKTGARFERKSDFAENINGLNSSVRTVTFGTLSQATRSREMSPSYRHNSSTRSSKIFTPMDDSNRGNQRERSGSSGAFVGGEGSRLFDNAVDTKSYGGL